MNAREVHSAARFSGNVTVTCIAYGLSDCSRLLNMYLKPRTSPLGIVMPADAVDEIPCCDGDEVGQFVARTVNKMLDLQGIIQALGRVGQGKFWVVVTSQEKLNELVGGLDDSRVELARLMDRFPLQVHLEPSDISEVTSKRVLAKTAEAEKELGKLYEQHRGSLMANTTLTADIRLPELTRQAFIDLYPMLPYQVDMIIHVVSGLRTQGGASRHVGGANRTVIKIAHQLLVHPKVGLAHHPLGELARIDHVYDLVRDNIDSTIREDQAECDQMLTTARRQSQVERENVFWVVRLDERIDREVTEMFRSKEMLTKRERGAQTAAETRLLAEEARRRDNHRAEIKRQLEQAFLAGTIFFQGGDRSPDENDRTVGKAAEAVMAQALPDVFDRFAMGAARVAKRDANGDANGDTALSPALSTPRRVPRQG